MISLGLILQSDVINGASKSNMTLMSWMETWDLNLRFTRVLRLPPGCSPPPSALASLQPPASCLFPVPAQQPESRWRGSQSTWLQSAARCTHYSRHPVIYFSSELIAKSIWSGEKTSTQACHEKQGTEEAFHLGRHSLQKQGEEAVATWFVRGAELPNSAPAMRCLDPVIPF